MFPPLHGQTNYTRSDTRKHVTRAALLLKRHDVLRPPQLTDIRRTLRPNLAQPHTSVLLLVTA